MMNQPPVSKPPDERRVREDGGPGEAARPAGAERRSHRLVAAFGYAFAGLWYLLRTQRNAQIHSLIGFCALVLATVLGLERWEWLILVLTIGLVLFAEGVNTAIESTVDVATSRYHPLARVAKDVGAGSVLVCALTAIVVGCLLFIPHLWPLALGFWNTVRNATG